VSLAGLEKTDIAELVRVAETSDRTIMDLASLVQQMGKEVIVVRDSPGFFSQRLSIGFLNEGMALVGEGVPAALVERAAVGAGMADGPLAVLDRVLPEAF
jgi:3-hydroxyacyl-CoA dehydrogenase/enoyl-CoA hydratase/3-hydroxybutyryl-CoA epimerase